MRDRLLELVLIAACAAGCSGTAEQATAPSATTTPAAARSPEPPSPSTPVAAPPTTSPSPPSPTSITHGDTAADRVARMRANADEAPRLREREAHLREGRRLAHANDHEGALRELEAGLAITPTDATLRCEAGLQAYRLGRLDAALEHLNRGVARAGPPSTKAACLYNLGRVLEDRGDPDGAEYCYVESLALRPNTTVSQRLTALRASFEEEEDEEDEEEGWDEDDGVALDLAVLQRAEPFVSIEALCDALSDACYDAHHERFAPPEPSPTLREVLVLDVESREDLALIGFLVIHSDRGFRAVGRVTWTDMTDTYGRQEAVERVTGVRFEGDAVVVEVEGHFDESDGEAQAYFECESTHPEDEEARDQCFDAASAELGPPEHWTDTTRFVPRHGTFAAESAE